MTQNNLKKSRGNLGRLPRGKRTPEREYYRPILRVLARRGGSGRTADVLEEVYEEVQEILTEADLQPVPSGNEPCWRDTARWARNDMVKNGLLKSGSPYGTWEISEKGYQYLQDHDQDQDRV